MIPPSNTTLSIQTCIKKKMIEVTGKYFGGISLILVSFREDNFSFPSCSFLVPYLQSLSIS